MAAPQAGFVPQDNSFQQASQLFVSSLLGAQQLVQEKHKADLVSTTDLVNSQLKRYGDWNTFMDREPELAKQYFSLVSGGNNALVDSMMKSPVAAKEMFSAMSNQIAQGNAEVTTEAAPNQGGGGQAASGANGGAVNAGATNEGAGKNAPAATPAATTVETPTPGAGPIGAAPTPATVPAGKGPLFNIVRALGEGAAGAAAGSLYGPGGAAVGGGAGIAAGIAQANQDKNAPPVEVSQGPRRIPSVSPDVLRGSTQTTSSQPSSNDMTGFRKYLQQEKLFSGVKDQGTPEEDRKLLADNAGYYKQYKEAAAAGQSGQQNQGGGGSLSASFISKSSGSAGMTSAATDAQTKINAGQPLTGREVMALNQSIGSGVRTTIKETVTPEVKAALKSHGIDLDVMTKLVGQLSNTKPEDLPPELRSFYSPEDEQRLQNDRSYAIALHAAGVADKEVLLDAMKLDLQGRALALDATKLDIEEKAGKANPLLVPLINSAQATLAAAQKSMSPEDYTRAISDQSQSPDIKAAHEFMQNLYATALGTDASKVLMKYPYGWPRSWVQAPKTYGVTSATGGGAGPATGVGGENPTLNEAQKQANDYVYGRAGK